MLSSRTPRPTSSTAAAGSPASSPQTPTQRPCAAAASVTRGDQPQHRRDRALEQRRHASLPRSAAIVYCARSFVPIEKKSTSRREAIGGQRGGRDLDHDPHLELGGRRARARRRPAAPAPRGTRPSVATIGNMTIDRVLGRDAHDRPQLHARAARAGPAPGGCRARPRNGLSSGACGRKGSGLSAPASSVRTISGRPLERRARSRVGRELLLLGRALVAVEEQELACAAARRRRRPARRAAGASRAAPMLAATSMRRAVAREGGLARARRERRAWRSRRPRPGAPRSPSRRAAGSTLTVPAPPSSTAACPPAPRAPPVPSPTTAGMPSERARIAACEVAPPRAMAMPADRVAVERRRSPGVSSAATRMPAAVGAPRPRAPRPGGRSTRRPTSRRRRRARAGTRRRRPRMRARPPRRRRAPGARGGGPVLDRAPRRAEQGARASSADGRRRSRPRPRRRARRRARGRLDVAARRPGPLEPRATPRPGSPAGPVGSSSRAAGAAGAPARGDAGAAAARSARAPGAAAGGRGLALGSAAAPPGPRRVAVGSSPKFSRAARRSPRAPRLRRARARHGHLVALAHAERGDAARLRASAGPGRCSRRPVDTGVEPSRAVATTAPPDARAARARSRRPPAASAAVLDDIGAAGAAGVPVRSLDAELHRLAGASAAARLPPPPRRGRRRRARGRRGGDRALDQRRFAEHHPLARSRPSSDRHLGAHEGAAQVHEHEHAIVPPAARSIAHLDELGVGADRPVAGRPCRPRARSSPPRRPSRAPARRCRRRRRRCGRCGDDADHRADNRTDPPASPVRGARGQRGLRQSSNTEPNQ